MFSFIALAYAVLSIPSLSGPVMDQAGIFSSEERAQLSELIRSKKDIAQFQIWTVNSLEGDAIESLSIRAVEQWKLGTEKKDNGLLILIAKDDRRMCVEVGQGLEGSIPDVIAGRVVDQIMKPAFRSGGYYEGTVQAVRYLYGRIESPETTPDLKPTRASRRSGGSIPFPLIVVFVILVIILRIFAFLNPASRLSRYSRGGGWYGGGGSGWGGGGGGGWSGGGGGFSGGGSSGSW